MDHKGSYGRASRRPEIPCSSPRTPTTNSMVDQTTNTHRVPRAEPNSFRIRPKIQTVGGASVSGHFGYAGRRQTIAPTSARRARVECLAGCPGIGRPFLHSPPRGVVSEESASRGCSGNHGRCASTCSRRGRYSPAELNKAVKISGPLAERTKLSYRGGPMQESCSTTLRTILRRDHPRRFAVPI
jgi:hypothetical protein